MAAHPPVFLPFSLSLSLYLCLSTLSFIALSKLLILISLSLSHSLSTSVFTPKKSFTPHPSHPTNLLAEGRGHWLPLAQPREIWSTVSPSAPRGVPANLPAPSPPDVKHHRHKGQGGESPALWYQPPSSSLTRACPPICQHDCEEVDPPWTCWLLFAGNSCVKLHFSTWPCCPLQLFTNSGGGNLIICVTMSSLQTSL